LRYEQPRNRHRPHPEATGKRLASRDCTEIEFIAGVREGFDQIERGEGVAAEKGPADDPFMDCKVILSPRAIQDLGEIVRYISFDNPDAAEKFGYALIDAALSLGSLPERGRLVPEFGDGITREIIYAPYRIVYRINTQQKAVWVSRFWHAAQGAPEIGFD
jgi:plasmid stabilization system protein ParE